MSRFAKPLILVVGNGLLWILEILVENKYQNEIAQWSDGFWGILRAVFENSTIIFPILIVISAAVALWWSNRKSVKIPAAKSADLTSTQKQMICNLANVSDGSMLYQGLLSEMGVKGNRRLNTERVALERLGLLIYGNKRVVLTDAGWQAHDELLSQSGQDDSATPTPDMDAWAVANYILDETEIGRDKEWHQVVELLRWSTSGESHPLAVWGTDISITQRNRIRADVLNDHTLEIELGGTSWIGKRAEFAHRLKGGSDLHLYENLKFCPKQVREHWPQSTFRKKDRLRERQLIRAWRWVVDHGYDRNRHRAVRLKGEEALEAIVYGNPVWEELRPMLNETNLPMPRDEMELAGWALWLVQNIDRIEKEWGLVATDYPTNS
jgi:hypothetical protein